MEYYLSILQRQTTHLSFCRSDCFLNDTNIIFMYESSKNEETANFVYVLFCFCGGFFFFGGGFVCMFVCLFVCTSQQTML